MGGTTEADGHFRRTVAVVEGEVRDSSWQQLDLDLNLATLRSHTGGHPEAISAPATGAVLTFPETGAALLSALKVALGRRVPASAFVAIGRRGSAPMPKPPTKNSPGTHSANDNVASGDKRSVWRDLVFLAILAATVLGAFWSGRVQGVQKVIVVPGPSSFHSVVT